MGEVNITTIWNADYFSKFIEVWRQKETALQTTKLANILLSNASHEGMQNSIPALEISHRPL